MYQKIRKNKYVGDISGVKDLQIVALLVVPTKRNPVRTMVAGQVFLKAMRLELVLVPTNATGFEEKRCYCHVLRSHACMMTIL